MLPNHLSPPAWGNTGGKRGAVKEEEEEGGMEEEIALKGYFILSCIYNLFLVPRVKCNLCSII